MLNCDKLWELQKVGLQGGGGSEKALTTKNWQSRC